MKGLLSAAIIAAGFGVALASPAGAAQLRLPPGLTSFGVGFGVGFGAGLSNATGVAALTDSSQAYTYTGDIFAQPPALLTTATGAPVLPQNFVASRFAASQALSEKLALDTGYDLNLGARFGDYGQMPSPLIADSDLVALANGGRYAGVTFVPAAALHMRLGVAMRDGHSDDGAFDPSSHLGLPLAADASGSRSLLAGLSWSLSDWADLGLNAIHNQQTGVAFGVPGGGDRTQTNALDVTANFKFGNGWVTTASYAQGLTQLDQRTSNFAQYDTRAYSFAIAKHGLFGDDALGFSLSRPAPGLLDNGFDAVAASGDLPPAFIANSRLPDQNSETDLQLGYVTSFLNGVELQANAAYQMNYQGQTGATSLSLLSRAKIKF